MCGIAGLWCESAALAQRQKLVANAKKMSASLYHRGPDDSGLWHDDTIALAHQRLSIQDLSAHGHQPMTSHCQRYVLVFNGEIYNFIEIKQQLEKLGKSFIGHSDSEVLLESIAVYGLEKALSLFNGMFAIALWDKKNRSLTLAQDRAAKKPLYFGWLDNAFVFASELQAIKAIAQQPLTIDKQALTLYLTYNYVPAPHVIFKNLYKLNQGSYITLTSDIFADKTSIASQIKSYWSPYEIAKQQFNNKFTGSYQEATNTLQHHIEDATRMRLVADVPVGVMLSGGIDSTIVTSVAQKISASPINTFSIGFENSKKSEAAAAKAIASHLGTNHHELYVSGQDALDVLPEIPKIYDEPFGDSSQVPTYILSKLAKSEVSVALTGDGGDELFYGYKRYFSSSKLWKKGEKIPYPIRYPLAKSLDKAGRLALTEHKFLEHANCLSAQHPLDLYLSRIAKFSEPQRLVLGASAIALANIAQIKQLDIIEPEFNMMLMDYTSYLTGDILVKVDRASMAVSLEARNPLLDHHIVEFAWSLPTAYKYKNKVGKAILKDVLARYVPTALTDRPKQGFGSPIKQWLQGPLRDWAEELLSTEKIRQQGLLDAELVSYLWRKCKNNPNGSHSRIWTILMFQAWLEEQQDASKDLTFADKCVDMLRGKTLIPSSSEVLA